MASRVSERGQITEARTVAASRTTFSQIMLPDDASPAGNVHGGTIANVRAMRQHGYHYLCPLLSWAAVKRLQAKGIIDAQGRRIRKDLPPDMQEGSGCDLG